MSAVLAGGCQTDVKVAEGDDVRMSALASELTSTDVRMSGGGRDTRDTPQPVPMEDGLV